MSSGFGRSGSNRDGLGRPHSNYLVVSDLEIRLSAAEFLQCFQRPRVRSLWVTGRITHHLTCMRWPAFTGITWLCADPTDRIVAFEVETESVSTICLRDQQQRQRPWRGGPPRPGGGGQNPRARAIGLPLRKSVGYFSELQACLLLMGGLL
jgi:hypothetical protein